MSTILDQIIAQKHIEVAALKASTTASALEKSGFFAKTTNSMKLALSHPASSGIIAEFKRKSPSKGIINDSFTPEQVTTSYVAAGAAALSVLTDTQFFGGSNQDFTQARIANPNTPIIRKDFIIDPMQILEAKALGADVILLIAANLEVSQLLDLAKFTKSLGMETLLEVHNLDELNANLSEYIDVVGVNNRNLKNFAEQNVDASIQLSEHIPASFIKISESCIAGPQTVTQLRGYGYQGFLIGESFMKTDNPGLALQHFIHGQ
jgi:indole-3-glycerol phosphate synthase